MAIPWLIAAAAVAVIAKVANDENEREAEAQRRAEMAREQARKNREMEERRRAELERERIKKEREQKLLSARDDFLRRGESIGTDIAQSLKGWIDVEFEKKPTFIAELQPSSLTSMSNNEEKNRPKGLLPASGIIPNDAQKNLEFYSSIYAIKLNQGANLTKAIEEINEIEKELGQIAQLKEKIYNTKARILQNA